MQGVGWMNFYRTPNVRRRTINVKSVVETSTPIRYSNQTGTGKNLPRDINRMSSPA